MLLKKGKRYRLVFQFQPPFTVVQQFRGWESKMKAQASEYTVIQLGELGSSVSYLPAADVDIVPGRATLDIGGSKTVLTNILAETLASRTVAVTPL